MTFHIHRPHPDNPCTYVLSTPCFGRDVEEHACCKGLGLRMRCEIHIRLRRANGSWFFTRDVFGARTYELLEDPLSADFGAKHAWLIFRVEPKVDVPMYIEGERHHLSLHAAKHALARHLASSEPDLF